MESYQTYQTKNSLPIIKETYLVSETEVGSIMIILNDIIDILPNKKIIAWCGTIQLCKAWCEKFEVYKHLFPEINKIETFIDYSNYKSDDYQKFREKDSFSILFCAQKHREGSDIKKLDCCIFLDKVKNRSSIPFIQSIGRVLRKDPLDLFKTCGIVIDGVVKDNEHYEKIFIDKILGYYFALANLTDVSDIVDGRSFNKYEEYMKIRDVVKFDKENKIININVGNTIIPINCKKLDWNKIVSQFSILLEKRVNLTPEEAFEMHIKKVKVMEPFKNVENDFWEEYHKLDHELLGIPIDIFEPYKEIWENKTWYDILGFKYYNYNEFKHYLSEYKINSEKKLHEYLRKQNCNKFPFYPDEYYRLSGWTNWNIHLDKKDFII